MLLPDDGTNSCEKRNHYRRYFVLANRREKLHLKRCFGVFEELETNAEAEDDWKKDQIVAKVTQ